ncbi:transketolase (plasmid) [Azospirillum sp. 412522]|nr:transketolase [Azospirillum sp. 412522]MBY6266470.1 transketolase [Azospirillum sp. 412522]
MIDLNTLNLRARQLRYRIIETSHRTGTPHLGSCLSCTDLLSVLYFDFLRLDPSQPAASGRDRFILSKGHAAPALFQVLAMRGFYDDSRLSDYGQNGSIFAEHPPSPACLPGIEAATGSLGHGLPIGLGMALAARIQALPYRVVVLVGDGECNEGSVWEAALLAAAQRASNLCVIVDFNKWQATGRSQTIMAMDPLVDKWAAFGWNAMEVDGHDHAAIKDALNCFAGTTDRPTAIVAHTVKGSGVSFMQDDNNWHYRIPSEEEVRRARAELRIEA